MTSAAGVLCYLFGVIALWFGFYTSSDDFVGFICRLRERAASRTEDPTVAQRMREGKLERSLALASSALILVGTCFFVAGYYGPDSHPWVKGTLSLATGFIVSEALLNLVSASLSLIEKTAGQAGLRARVAFVFFIILAIPLWISQYLVGTECIAFVGGILASSLLNTYQGVFFFSRKKNDAEHQ